MIQRNYMEKIFLFILAFVGLHLPTLTFKHGKLIGLGFERIIDKK